jgi:hypothetical protein
LYFLYHLRIDATADDGSFGRLINDDHLSPNLKARLIKIKNDYVPAFFALHDIPSGEEIAYDYGGVDYPWRRKPVSLIVTVNKCRVTTLKQFPPRVRFSKLN